MTTIAFNQLAGTFVITPNLSIPDDLHRFKLVMSDWGQVARTLALTFDISYDNGTNWLPLGKLNPIPGVFTNTARSLPGCTLDPLAMPCATCGQLYLPGDSRYDRALSHSTIALKPGVQLSDVATRLGKPVPTLSEYLTKLAVANGVDMDGQCFVRTFHTPTPAVLSVRRLVRITATVVGGRVTTTLTWTVS